MIQVQNISKGYGKQLLLENASFNLSPGERVGVVGRNGHGKSTLFKLILGQEELDAGHIVIPRDYTIGHLSQHIEFSEPTVLEEACLSLPIFEGGWSETYKAEAVLDGLGFSQEECGRPPSELSGGFQVRLNLAKLLVSEPNLLLLDEPTNYLDIVSVRWLIRFLTSWQSELMLITHDRGFMDKVTTHTLAIHRGNIKKVAGPTGKVYEQIALEEEIHEKTRLNQEKKREKEELFIERFRAKASKATAVQSRIKALERMGKLEELATISDLSFRFNACPFPGRFPLHVKELEFGFEPDDPLISDVTLSVGKNDRIGVIGKNGRGKTTFLNLLAGELRPTSGSVQYSEKTVYSYFGQTNVNRLPESKTIEQVVLEVHPDSNRTAVRSICGAMMFEGDAALKKISVLSGGERSRVLLAQILARPANTLYLDEPTNHLDMQSSDSLLEAIKEFPGAIIFVTHDERFLDELANRLIIFDRGGVEVFEGGYQDFLRRIGWEGEGDSAGDISQSKDKSTLSKKELRQLRAAQKEQERTVLEPVKQKITDVEAKIVALEKEVENAQAKLVEITKDGYSDAAAKISREIHQHKEQIEQLFEQLDTLSKELHQAHAQLAKLP